MIEKVETSMLFATPLMRAQVADHAALDAALLAEGERMRAASEGVKKSNRGGWHSEGNLFSSEAAPVQQLRAEAVRAVRAMTLSVAPKLDLDSLEMKLFAWMNMNPPGSYNTPHTHPGAHWSGVYYVSQPTVEKGNSGMIEFLAPRTELPGMKILGAETFRTKKKIRPKAGEIVMFPSYLLHWVYPNETDEERVTIAFNATFSEKG